MPDEPTPRARDAPRAAGPPPRAPLPLLMSCGCGSGCTCGCQSGAPCSCGGGCCA